MGWFVFAPGWLWFGFGLALMLFGSGWLCFGLALVWLWVGFGFAGLLWVDFGFVLVWSPNNINVQPEANPGPTQFEHVENLFWVGLV